MNFTKLETLNFEELFQKIDIDITNSYLVSYPFFIDYFRKIQTLNVENIILWSYFVYGWMPTILKKINLERIDDVVNILQRTKEWHFIGKDEFILLKTYLNNSIIGVSKLLHFINPDIYPIWDSKIAEFLGKKRNGNINNIDLYIQYLNDLHELRKRPIIHALRECLIEKLGYDITNIRTIEFILFQAGHNEHTE